MIDQPMDLRVKKFIIPMLRKQWLWWPARQTVIKRCMIDRGNYKCEICKQSGFKRNDLQVDHIEPVQTLETKLITWIDLVIFITRLFVEADKLQGACDPCHKLKSGIENKMRKFYRDEKKKNVSKDAKPLDKSNKK